MKTAMNMRSLAPMGLGVGPGERGASLITAILLLGVVASITAVLLPNATTLAAVVAKIAAPLSTRSRPRLSRRASPAKRPAAVTAVVRPARRSAL